MLVQDYVGMFAVTSGLGMDKLLASYEAKNDDYGKIMAQVCIIRVCASRVAGMLVCLVLTQCFDASDHDHTIRISCIT